MTLVDGIIINVSKYKDNDAIFNILTKNGIVTALGRGSLKLSNKTNRYTRPFIYGQFDLYTGKIGGYKIRDCKIYTDFSSIFSGFEDLLILDFVLELTFKMLVENIFYDGFFELLLKFLSNYSSHNNYVLVCYYFAKMLSLNGSKLNLKECVECGSDSEIIGIDFSKGGIICKKHQNLNFSRISKEDFDLYYCLFYGGIDDIIDQKIDKNKFIQIIKNFYIMLVSFYGINLNSVKLLDTIL